MTQSRVSSYFLSISFLGATTIIKLHAQNGPFLQLPYSQKALTTLYSLYSWFPMALIHHITTTIMNMHAQIACCFILMT